jgi:cystathionine gamma-synthase
VLCCPHPKEVTVREETKAIHVPTRRSNGSIAPAIELSTTFEHGPAGEHLHGFEYIRDNNPNVSDLEARLAAVEGADGAVAFGSGMAAGAAILSRLPPGSRVLFHKDLYFDFRKLAERILPNWGLRCESIDMTDASARSRALAKGADLVWFETPSNPSIDVLDIETICREAKASDAEVLVDGTFATPVVQRPLELGADYVLHSLTKYMGGHSDVQGGAIAYKGDASIRDELAEKRRLTGGVLSPFNAWLISRGLQTLYCRMDRHCANAQLVAEALDGVGEIARVRFPWLPTHPSYDIARKQMSSGGAMISIELQGGKEAAIRVASNVKLFVNATSLGGVESLIEHRASVEGPASTTSPGLLRLSIGLENPDDLIDDLRSAIAST